METSPILQRRVADDQSVTDCILSIIGTHERADPAEFDQRLYDAVDPDALESLFGRESVACTVEFTYRGYEVTVTGDRRVSVRSQASE